MEYQTREPLGRAQDPDDTPVGIVALWRLLWRNRVRIVVPAIALTIVGLLLALRSDDIYTADAQVLLTRGNLEIIEFDSAGAVDVNTGAIANALTILSSRTLALQVVEQLDLTEDPEINPNLAEGLTSDDADFYSDAAVRQLAITWLESTTQIDSIPGSNVIAIRTVTTDAQRAAAVANAYAEAYLEYQRQLGRNETERAVEALSSRVSELRLQLEEDQQALQDFRSSAKVVTPESAASIALEAASIRSRLQEAETGLADLDASLTQLSEVKEDDMQGLRRVIDGSDVLSRLEQSALGRQIGRGSLMQDMEGLRKAADTERQRLERLRAALMEVRDAIDIRMAETDEFTATQRRLETELETTSQVYEASLARLKNLATQTQLRDAGAQILVPAEVPHMPSAQGRRRMVAIAGFLGLFLGIVYVMLREAANNRVRGSFDLSGLAGVDFVVPIPPVPKQPVDQAPEESRFFEGIRNLRRQILSSARPQGAPLVTGVFSAQPGEDTSTVTDALARSFAIIEKSVIIIDGDMRSGALSRSLGLEADAQGLKNVLGGTSGVDAAIQTLPGTGVDLMPAGWSDANPADLLESARFGELIAMLRDRYDVVLVDTPALLAVPDASRIAAQLDQHVFVAEHNHSPRSAVNNALAVLRSAGAIRPLMALCNAPDIFGPQKT